MNYLFVSMLLALTCSLAADSSQNRQDDIKRQQRNYDNRQHENRQEDIKKQQQAEENRAQVTK